MQEVQRLCRELHGGAARGEPARRSSILLSTVLQRSLPCAQSHTPWMQVSVQRLYVGSFMTALDMAGLSLSVLRLDDGRLQRLDAPTKV